MNLPIVIVGGSVALVEGGTEVVLDVAEFTTDLVGPRTFVVRWRQYLSMLELSH